MISLKPIAKKPRPLAIVGYACELAAANDTLELRCQRKSWRKTFDKHGNELSVQVEARSLWMVANLGTLLILQPLDISRVETGHYQICGVVNDYKSFHVKRIANDPVPCGPVVAFKLRRTA